MLIWLRSAATPGEKRAQVSNCAEAAVGESRKEHMHTGSTTDIVEGEVRDTGVELQQQGERLANTTASAENGDLGGL